MRNDSPIHRMLRAVLLSGVILLGGCYHGLKMKREQELQCPTDIRQKVPWCVGEDAIFYCPCGPDSEFYGMKPTCWGEWPASGADWRNAFCGSPSECCPVPLGEIVPGETAVGVPMQPEPVPAENGEFYNPFDTSRQTLPVQPPAVETDGTPPSQPDPQVPAQLPEVVPDAQGALFPPPDIQASSNFCWMSPHQGTQSLAGGLTEGWVEYPIVQAIPSTVPVARQATRLQVTIPPAPVADQPSEMVLVNLQLQARKATLDWEQELIPQKIPEMQAPGQRAADNESLQIRLLDNLDKHDKSPSFAE